MQGLVNRIPFFYGWVIVGVGFCVSFLSFGMLTYVRGIYLPLFAEAFATGRYDITLGFTAEGVVAGSFAPFLGFLLDRFSPRKMLLFGLTLVVTGYVLLSLVQTLWQLYAVMAVCFGFGMTSLGAFTVQRITVSWFSQRRGFALACVILGASMSGMIMPSVCVYLIEVLGWRDSLLVLGLLIAVVLTPLGVFLLRDAPRQLGLAVDGQATGSDSEPVSTTVAAAQELWPPLRIVRRVSFWNIVLVFGVMLCVFGTVATHAFGHITDLGLTEYQAAGGFFAMTLCAALGKPLVGLLTDVANVRVSIWSSLAMLAIGLLVLAEADRYFAVIVGMSCFGFGYAGMLPLRSYSVAAAVGQRNFGLANGLMNFAILPLTLAASPVAAWIYDFSGSYAFAFQLLVIGVAVAAIGPFFINHDGVSEE
ncbi:MAG: MFS transporter [Pseudomonadales bacterium]|nr:MFS transporter [Pseudomonadales bacterium]